MEENGRKNNWERKWKVRQERAKQTDICPECMRDIGKDGL
jgi:hypothetical protein